MNILTDALPEAVEIDGEAWPINADFYVGVRFELLMQDRTLTDEERLGRALSLYYPQVPPDLPAALDGLLWFYSCGRDRGREPAAPSGDGSTPQKAVKKAYCFEQDADLIFAAFWEAYGIDLNAVEGLHWWKFRALFKALPSECEFCKVMGYRTADTKGMRDLVGKPAGAGFIVGFEDAMADFHRRATAVVDAETSKITANVSAQADGRAAAQGVTREVHNTTRTVEKIATVKGDGVTDELVRMLGLRIEAEDRRRGSRLDK